MPFAVKKMVFQSAVISSITYGSETWLTNSIKPIESKYNAMVRLLLGVRPNTCLKLCLLEAGIEPLVHVVRKKRCGFLVDMFRRVDYEHPFHHMFRICVENNTPAATFMNEALRYRTASQLRSMATEVANEQNATKLMHYFEKLNPDLSLHSVYSTNSYIPDYLRVSFSRLRLMSHSLKVETGRWSRVPREQRLCDRCDAQHLQDEEHVVLTCSATQHIRNRYGMLNFESLRTVMEERTHLKELAEMVHAVLNVRVPRLVVTFKKFRCTNFF